VPHDAPNLADLRAAAVVFNGFANVDSTWLSLVDATKPAVDLAHAEHRTMLLRWLNSWGCRIRYPREGEPAPFDTGISAWWESWRSALPQVSLALLTDADIDATATAYAELAAVEVSAGRTRRSLGPTAAAKALYALRPQAIMPWDAAIARQLHADRDGAAFGRHLRLGRAWASAVIEESGGGENAVPGLVGRPAVSLAKILDEYLYVTITMAGQEARSQKSGRGARSRKDDTPITADDVRAVALSLPRAYEALVGDRVKFRVGRIVFLALSPDETVMGFGYPREERAALIASEPDKFFWPRASDMRYQWLRVWLNKIDHDELREIIVGSWKMTVPKKVWSEFWPVTKS
jgi:hypothetical protein